MDLDAIRDLMSTVRDNDTELGTESPATDDQIATLESLLGVSLPADYRVFLAQFGAMRSDESTISGIMSSDPAAQELGSTCCDTQRYRDDFSLPHHLVVVQPNEDAPYCIDTSANDSPVVCFQLNTGTYQTIAKSFGEFLADWFLKPLSTSA